jgi:PAT family beta-lactamase induction signal transducer AmpG
MTEAAGARARPKKRMLMDVIRALRRPKVAVMLGLGFSSGLPFLLSGNTFGYWLADAGTTRTTIGFMSWVGWAYAFKVLWAPFLDRLDAPILGRLLGRRRGWMLIAQALVAAALAGMAIVGASGGLLALAGFAVVVAFASATQDIVVDAWRIEAAEDSDELGLLSATYQLGYRAALLVTDALILISAEKLGWPMSYAVMAVLMTIGLAATWFAIEPKTTDQILPPLWTRRGMFDAIIGPFVAFFRAHGAFALLMLTTILLYRLPDFVMGPMANPFYKDLGLTKIDVGVVRGTVGLTFSLIGIASGGLFALRFGLWRALIAGQIVQSLAVASYAALAFVGPDLRIFGAVMACDSFGISFAGVALVTYMSSLTSLGYTATQYALLSSTYAFLGKFLKGFSGLAVDWLAQGRELLTAYAIFFAGCGAIGIPSLVLCFFLLSAHRKRGETVPAPQASGL